MGFNFKNSLPIWTQLADQLRERIVTGEYPAGGHFPSVRELAAEAEVNPNTMQRAMSQLESEGLLVTSRNFGRSVTDDEAVIEETRMTLAKERTARFLESMKALEIPARDAAAMVVKEAEAASEKTTAAIPAVVAEEAGQTIRAEVENG